MDSTKQISNIQSLSYIFKEIYRFNTYSIIGRQMILTTKLDLWVSELTLR